MNNLLENSYVSFVNLDHRKDRLARMVGTLTKAGLPINRTRGFPPSEYKGDPAKVRCMLHDKGSHKATPGAIGCHYSQVKIMEDAFVQDKHAFVLEDDLIICSDWPKRADLIAQFCAANPWDIIWLGGTFHINPPWWHKTDLKRDAECVPKWPRFMRTYGCFCTYAYIVNRSSLPKVLGVLDAGVSESIGIDWLFIQLQPLLKTYAFVPGCMTQYDNVSDIGLNRDKSPATTVFSGFAKLGPYWYQDRMEDFDPTKFNWHEASLLERG